jgi:hypothetical protein
MRKLIMLIPLCGLLLAIPIVKAQAPGGGRGLSKAADIEDLVSKMMAFDKDKDSKLTRTEVTDERLLGLFDRADADKDGSVTKAELTALAEKEYVGGRSGGGGPGGPGGPGGFGGPGGPGGRPGEILSAPIQQRLGLSDEQKAKIAELQAEVDGKLAKILNSEQKAQLKQMRERGPGGPGGGGPGGPGGGRRGGPGGGPPGESRD